MKIITIVGANKVKSTNTLHRVGKDLTVEGDEQMSVCDGYHTFEELYEHRITLFIALCKITEYRNQVWKNEGVKMSGENDVWRSKLHSDGSKIDGWFVLGIGKNKGSQRTYHLPLSKWEEVELVETLEKAPEWDNHTSNDVLKRLKEF